MEKSRVVLLYFSVPSAFSVVNRCLMEIGIIADDLTGAADAVALFAARGYRASVGFRARQSGEPFPPADGEALAYDTATRDVATDQEQAIQAAVRQAARRLAEWKPRVVFKKIDSTLRGHLRLELEAVREEFPDRLAIVCPAFPAQGRTVEAGVLRIHNVPWTATEFAPPDLSESPTVRSAFGMEADTGVRNVTNGNIRQGVEALEARLQAWRRVGVHTLYCDTDCDERLYVLATTILRRPQLYLPVGSAGLAQAIGVCMPMCPTASPASYPKLTPFYKGRVLVVAGSLHSASRRQEAILSERLQATPVAVGQADGAESNLEQAAAEICRRYADGQRIVVLTTPDTREENNAQGIADTLGSIALRVCRRQWQARQPVDALVICGGNTALELCQAFGGTGLRIAGELQPGIVFSSLIAAPEGAHSLSFDGLPLVTKAGGFGDEGTLARCVGLR